MNFSKGLKAKIGKQDIIYFMPNNIALSLSLTKKSFKKAFSIHKNLVSKSQSKTIKLELKDKSELFDYFEEIISCVTFAFISVEAMANSAIPEEFSREITNSKKIKEIWTKENIERWMSTSQKISTILPEIFDCGDVKQENFWNKFTELEKARNDIVHQKTINQGTAMDDNLFSLLLEPSIFDKIKSAFSVIEHFYKLENSHPYFPLGMGIAKMNFKEAQEDMRKSYLGGGPGAFASGIVWLTAGITALITTKQVSVIVFFFGGMLIHPIGIMLSKALKRSGKHKNGNPLSYLALESTFMLFIGLFIAYVTFQIRPNWFFPIMILIIGGRYLLFSTIYGMRIYWIFGALLIVAGVCGILFKPPFHLIGLVGGIIEILFSFIIINLEKKEID
jgi:hypothetical protein